MTMFHDAFVSRFTINGDELRIETHAFAFSFDETVPPGLIVVSGIRSIYESEIEVAAFAVESDDAEINALDVLPDGVRLVLFWHFWTPRAPTLCRGYWFPGATLHVEALSGGPLVPVKDVD